MYLGVGVIGYMGHQLYSSSQSMGSASRGNPVLGYNGSRALEPPMFPARPYDPPGESRYFPGDQLSNSMQHEKPGGRYMFGDRAPSERNPAETGSRLGSLGMDRYMPSEATQRVDSSRYYPSQNSSLFLNGSDTALYKSGDAAGFGSSSAYFSSRHSTGLVSPPLQQTQWPGAEPRGSMSGGVTGVKRPNEEVSQNLLGTHNTFGQNEAHSSVNALAKRPRMDGSSDLPIYPQRPGEKDCTHYMMTRTCKFGADCKFDHPFWVPAGGIPNWKEVPSAAINSETPPERPGEPECPYYMKTGICKFGSKCKFHHPKDRLATLKSDENVDGSEVKPATSDVVLLPERPGEQVCAFFVKTGICKYGAKCRFDHPKDKAGSLKISEHKVDGDSAITVGIEEQGISGVANGKTEKKVATLNIKPATMHNSKGLPIRPGETDCPFYVKTGSCKFGSNCRYNHSDRILVNAPSAVMPFAVQDQPLVGYSGMLPQHSLGAPMPPQRPGEPECTFYIKTGECKFGPSCKFHHPLNRPDPSVKLTLAGLPRREGETICPFYLKTGICKYGVNCKFDHPPPGELDTARAQPPVKLTLAGFPRREGEAVCPFYMKTGTCKYAATCKFDHPPPGEAVAKAVAMAATTEDIPEDNNKMDSGIAAAKATDENPQV